MLKRNLKANTCRLCLNTKCDVDFEVIEVIKEILEIAWPKVNLEEGDKHSICSSCSEKLFAAFNFKSICTDTEDTIFPYVNSQETPLVDLREIYLKEKGDIWLIDVLEYQKICRLCFQLVRCGFVSLNDVDADIIDNYIPEVNFNATKDPVICKACSESLVRHGTFLRNCLAALEENRKVCGSPVEDRKYCITHEEIEIKEDEKSDPPPSLENVETIKNFKARCNSKKKNKKHPSREVRTYTCDRCDFKTTYKSSLKRHCMKYKVSPTPTYISKRRDASSPCPLRDQARMFQCENCPYRTHDNRAFISHWSTHEVPSEVKVYQCEKCHYRVTREHYFRRHLLRHEDSETIENFKGRRKSENTPVKNKKYPPRKVPAYSCNRCNFKTMYKRNLKRHCLTHFFPTPTCTSPKSQCESESRDASSPCPLRDRVQMYQCEKCPYRTSLRQAIIHHWWTHEMPSKTKVYQCEKCHHRVTRVDHFRLHQLRHEDSTVKNKKHLPRKVATYTCNRCDFKTMYKCALMRHCSSHVSPTPTYITLKSQCKSRDPLSPSPSRRQERMYRCEKCPYKVHDKKTFLIHWWTHEMPSDVKVYQCEKCHYRVTREDHFRRHQLRHEDGGEVEKYTCYKCGFKTRYKMCLIRHQLRHDKEQWRDIECYTTGDGELVYKCNVCKYETKDKRQLVVHQSDHLHSSRQPKFKCRRCPYTTDNKDKLTSHQSKHNSERKMLKCDLCSFQTIFKNNLIRHQLCHKKKCEVETYGCFKCDFKTKYKDNLKRHIAFLCKDVCNKGATVHQLGGAE